MQLSISGQDRKFLLKCDIQNARDTVFRLTVRNPAGNIVEHYGANLLAVQGRCEHPFFFALNDMPGIWNFEVRDVVTGRSAACAVEVR